MRGPNLLPMNAMRLLVLAAPLTVLLSAHAQTFTATGGLVPDDGTTVEFPVDVSGLPSALDTVSFGVESICLNAVHTWISDLSISLVAPDGTTVLLISGVGWDTDSFNLTCLRSDAPIMIMDGTPPYTGTFRPMGQLGIVNNGQDPNAQWRLRVTDTYPFADQGTIIDFAITFGSAPATYVPLVSSDLPIVEVTTSGIVIPSDVKVPATMGVVDNGVGMLNHPHDPFNAYSGNIGIELHGNSSLGFPKKNYAFELRGADQNDSSVALLGMPSQSDWLLLGNYSDKSLMNNVLSYDLGRRMGHWAPRTRYVEMMIDGAYLGTYVVAEKIKRDHDRVDIARLDTNELTGDDLTGGYILRIDWTQGGDPTVWSSPIPPPNASGSQTIDYTVVYPKAPAPAQQSYIEAYVDSFETALSSTGFADPLVGFRHYADVRSFIDVFLVNELSRNVDGYRLSTYLHKDKDSNGGKLHLGPLWDYDLAWRNADYCRGADVTGWAYRFNYDCDDGKLVPFWWNRFMQDPAFTAELSCRWDSLKTDVLSVERLHAWCDSIAGAIDQSQQRNFLIWPELGQYVWPNPSPIPTDYAGEVQELKDWIAARWQWIDVHLPGHCSYAGIPDDTRTKHIHAYPVPFNDRITVEGIDAFTGAATLLDASGRSLALIPDARTDGTVSFRVDPELAPGVYVLLLHSKEGPVRLPVLKGTFGAQN